MLVSRLCLSRHLPCAKFACPQCTMVSTPFYSFNEHKNTGTVEPFKFMMIRGICWHLVLEHDRHDRVTIYTIQHTVVCLLI